MRIIAIATLSVWILCLVGCDQRGLNTGSDKINVKYKEVAAVVVKVSKGTGKGAYFYVHKDIHTLIELEGGRRIIVPGDLGNPGDTIKLINIHKSSLYWNKK